MVCVCARVKEIGDNSQSITNFLGFLMNAEKLHIDFYFILFYLKFPSVVDAISIIDKMKK